MKEPIEELFKQSLKGHEMPYNPDAWKAMSARLDAVSPVAGPTSYLKYYIGAAVIGVAAVTTYVLLSSGNITENNSIPVAGKINTKQTSTLKKTYTTGNRDTQSSNSSVISNPTDLPSSLDKELQDSDIMKANSEAVNANPIENGLTNEMFEELNGPFGKVTTDSDPQIVSDNGPTPIIADAPQEMTIPAIADLCLNQETTITNPNGKEIYVLDGLNEIIKTIPANKSVVFKPTKVGNYSLGYIFDSQISSNSNFQVNRIPDADFMIDVVNKFENGLPSTHVEAISGQGTYIWKAEKQLANGLEADMHFYKKGDQTIQLTVDNGQCSATIEKTIYVENDYNLLAVNSFTPTSNDSRVNTFMPFSLTERDVKFVLTIIDGRDGGVVYETADASLPWDGTDIRTGRRSQSPQVYVWKAIIANPATNEPSEYLGTIIMN